MDNVFLYEKSIRILNERYDLAKRFKVDGKLDIALSVYHSCADYLTFMYELGLIDFKECCDLRNEHNDFFERVFF